jgi:hypothetical protein
VSVRDEFFIGVFCVNVFVRVCAHFGVKSWRIVLSTSLYKVYYKHVYIRVFVCLCACTRIHVCVCVCVCVCVFLNAINRTDWTVARCMNACKYERMYIVLRTFV